MLDYAFLPVYLCIGPVSVLSNVIVFIQLHVNKNANVSVCVYVCVQAGWRENHATFMSELKNLQASGLTTMGQALRSAFDLLNLNRLASGIDNYGQVQCVNMLKLLTLLRIVHPCTVYILRPCDSHVLHRHYSA